MMSGAVDTTWRYLCGALLCATMVACGSSAPPAKPDPSYVLLTQPGTRPPADELERAILGQLARLAPDSPTNVSGRVVIAGTPYAAASGRMCRSIAVRPTASAPTRTALACQMAAGWAYVPEVVRTPAKSPTPEVAK